MKNNSSVFHSKFIIDGVRQELTPEQILKEAMPCPDMTGNDAAEPAGDIVDETVDCVSATACYTPADIDRYLKLTMSSAGRDRVFPICAPESFTKQRIAATLIDALWQKGHFTLDNLTLNALWRWNQEEIGNMAAFYASVKAAAEYIYDLGCALEEFSYEEAEENHITFNISGVYQSEDEDIPQIESAGICPASMRNDPQSWLIYVPFDQCKFRLGSSLLAEKTGQAGGKAPDMYDPDYFIDCYEVIRELAEDGVVIAGATVGDGGLLTAAQKMCGECGISLDISGIKAAYNETDIVRILFADVPGVLIQIADNDFDYIDAQMLLQDIAYYPLGHPSATIEGARISRAAKSGVSGILAALMAGQPTEGED